MKIISFENYPRWTVDNHIAPKYDVPTLLRNTPWEGGTCKQKKLEVTLKILSTLGVVAALALTSPALAGSYIFESLESENIQIEANFTIENLDALIDADPAFNPYTASYEMDYTYFDGTTIQDIQYNGTAEITVTEFGPAKNVQIVFFDIYGTQTMETSFANGAFVNASWSSAFGSASGTITAVPENNSGNAPFTGSLAVVLGAMTIIPAVRRASKKAC